MISMNPLEDRLLRDALRLAPEARAALAGALLDSLDGEPDPGAEAAWDAEFRKRVAELDSGSTKTVPWSEARRNILDG